jgi:phosphonate transport system substrate-binding protein
MTYQITVSPDFSPDHIFGWYHFNTWLQQNLDTRIHLELYSDFESQREAILNDQIDLIYANPYDASMLVREKGFIAIARPRGISDEVVLTVNAESAFEEVEDLEQGLRLISTEDPDINMIGYILIEPANLTVDNTTMQQVDTYPIVARKLLRGDADAGFFLRDAFNDLTRLTRNNLRVLVESDISVIHHSLLVGPKLKQQSLDIQQMLLSMFDNKKGRDVLTSLGFAAWEAVDEEDTEFMIDIMDSLG